MLLNWLVFGAPRGTPQRKAASPAPHARAAVAEEKIQAGAVWTPVEHPGNAFGSCPVQRGAARHADVPTPRLPLRVACLRTESQSPAVTREPRRETSIGQPAAQVQEQARSAKTPGGQVSQPAHSPRQGAGETAARRGYKISLVHEDK